MKYPEWEHAHRQIPAGWVPEAQGNMEWRGSVHGGRVSV
jgi:hypothetical protein